MSSMYKSAFFINLAYYLSIQSFDATEMLFIYEFGGDVAEDEADGATVNCDILGSLGILRLEFHVFTKFRSTSIATRLSQRLNSSAHRCLMPLKFSRQSTHDC